MKNTFIILSVLLLTSSCSRKGVSLSIEDPFYTKTVEHQLIIDNNTENHYAFYSFKSTQDEGSPIIGTNHITIIDENNKVVGTSMIFINNSSRYDYSKDSLLMEHNKLRGFDKDLFWYSWNRNMKKDAVFLQPKEEKTINRKIALTADQNPGTGVYYHIKKGRKYFIQITVDFDSTAIKEQLTLFDLDSLRRNHITIFHGKLTSKKVPLVVE